MTMLFEAGSAAVRSRPPRPEPGRSIPTDRDEALREVYRRHHDRLVGYFVNRTHDRPLAEDLAHDTVLRFAGALDRFDPQRPVWPYLKTVASNLLIDHYRRETRQVTVDAEDEFADEAVPGTELDDTVVLREVLDRAVDDLSERQRIAIELRCERGWSVPDAAEFFGISAGAFSQLLWRARENLREVLDDTGAGLRGLVLPLLLDLRFRTRTASARIRELVQTPSTALGAEALAGVAIVATLGVTAAVVPFSADAEATPQPAPALDLVRQDVTPTAESPTAVDHDASIQPAPPPTPATTPAGPAEEPSPPSNDDATVIEAPDAVPNSNGAVTVDDDDDEYFVVSSEVAARTGIDQAEEVGAHGEDVFVSCGSSVGQLVCDDKGER